MLKSVASAWWSSGKLPNRGANRGKGQQLAGQGKEETEEGGEGDAREGGPAAEEEVTSQQGWSSRQLVGLNPRSRGCESHPLRLVTSPARTTPAEMSSAPSRAGGFAAPRLARQP